MGEWWTYSLSDFLMFSPRVYWRLVERHNEALWPLQPLMVAIGLALLLWSGRPLFQRVAAVLLAASWGFIGLVFLQDRYATINWGAGYLATLFYAEAALLAAAAFAWAGTPAAPRRWCAPVAIGYGVLLYPLLAVVTGRSWSSVEVFGVMPDPTAVVTLGYALQVPGRIRWLLMPIPIISLIVGGLTLLAMQEAAAAWTVAGGLALAGACMAKQAFRVRSPAQQ